jgi:hypothetical protein
LIVGDHVFDSWRSCFDKSNIDSIFESRVSLEEYECHLLANVEEWAKENPDDPDKENILQISNDWHSFSQRYAWNTWEFASFVAKKISI